MREGEVDPAATVAVVLAAGGGSRFAGPTHKLLAEIDGRTVVEHAVAAAVEAAIGPVIVVTGSVGLPVMDGAATVENSRWAEGMATSLQVALDAAKGLEAVVVGLADQPGISPDAWRRVASTTSTAIAVATYDGRRAHPVRLARSVWPLLPTGGDQGARALMRQRPELVTDVPCPGNCADIDTVGDLERFVGSRPVSPLR